MSANSPGFRPPRPTPRLRQLGPIALLNTIRTNPVECWTEEHFKQPIVLGGFPFARVAVLNDPTAIRKVLVENPNAYHKSMLERRILSARLRNGLAAVDGEQWAGQRRTLAPLFGRKTVMQFAPAMAGAAAALVERWGNRRLGDVVDIKIEMNALAFDVLTRSIFHAGLGGDPEAVRAAMMAFFAAAGHIDLFDLIGLPDAVPRITQWRMRGVLRTFEQALDAAIALGRRDLEEHPTKVARDMLDVLLAAKDPETGRGLNDAEVKANVLTFFSVGLIASVSLCGVLASKYNPSKKLRGKGVLLDGSSSVFKARCSRQAKHYFRNGLWAKTARWPVSRFLLRQKQTRR